MIAFQPFPNLESERFKLRCVKTTDASEIFDLRSNPETMQYVPRPIMKSKEEALEHIKMILDKIDTNEGINWAITTHDDDTLMGIIGHYRIVPENFRCEVGYMILPQHHNKGIITEVLGAVLEYGFTTMKMHSIEAIIDPKNMASEKVLLKNGFIKEAHLVENVFHNGEFCDTSIYSLLKRNYESHKNKKQHFRS